MSNQIDRFIEEGKKMIESSNLDDYDEWKNAIFFFVEKNGTPSMIKKMEKEVNRRPLYVTYVGDTTDLGETFRKHKLEQIITISSLLRAVEPYLEPIKQKETKPKRDKKRRFSLTIKNQIWDKQDGKCLNCKESLKQVHTHYDHITAWEGGGKSSEENCQALCANCHSIKTHEDRLAKQR